MKPKLTQSRLKEVLHYDPKTGIFTWTNRTSNAITVGSRAGGLSPNGYRRLCVDAHPYLEQRLAFLYMEGYFPEYDVDHINGVRDDNTWANLRHVTPICNSQNCKIYKTNSSGFSGVYWNRRARKWQARIMIGQKSIYLGHYDDLLEAALARITFEDWCPNWHCDERNINRQKVMAALRGSKTKN